MLKKALHFGKRARYQSVKVGLHSATWANTHKVKLITTSVVVSFAVVIAMMASMIINSYAYVVKIDGQTVGYVKNEAEYATLLNEIEENLISEGVDAKEILDQVKVETGTSDKFYEDVDKIEAEDLTDTLVDKSNTFANAYEISVGEDNLGIVASATDAQEIEKKLVEKFAAPEGEELVSTDLAEAVAVGKVKTELSKLSNTDEIVDKIVAGRNEVQIHTVADDDTFWDIALANGLSEEEILNTNPQIDPLTLKPGDEVKLNKANPYMHYTVVTKATANEPVAFNTVEEESADLYVGESQVKQEGANGEVSITREFTRVNGEITNVTEVSSTVVTAPTDKVILKGTKAKPAPVSVAKSSSNSSSRVAAPAYYPPTPAGDGTKSSVINIAAAQLGKPYSFGATGPNAFDCSGFVAYVYNNAGYGFGRGSAQSMYNRTARVGAGDLQPGDLVFFSGTYNAGEPVTHVGIYVGNGTMLHASPRGIAYDTITSGYHASHLYGYGRV
ncbi:MAG: C40 family peptidase [Clostridiales Family XIII bacterium]|jgi:cell wall-associated NlpC family hydrolase/uncharacterized protein YjgD (DUF1641 family)|nr:C40 family peptidase [Clostridiales Family XIII bacterium]